VDPTQEIAALITPTLADMGFELVRVTLGRGQRPTLQVMAERVDRTAMTVDHCAAISHAISALLDVADPIRSAYRLEVSSPGIDRPLVRPADYERFAGFEAQIETHEPIEGRRRFRGRLRGLAGEDIRLQMETGDCTIPLKSVRKAKLVLTDDLIRAAQAEGRN
jgi:ribosome maturation factor RimP